MTQSKHIRGFSLLEVMVALIIIAVGMLGIAKMQGLALSSTTASRSRALAAIEASSLAAAMQANRAYWSTTSAPALVTVTTSGGTAPLPTSSGALSTALGTVSGTLCSTTTMGMSLSCFCASGSSAPCTPVNLAAADVYDFSQSLATFLPTSSSTITCNTGDTPVDCIIHMSWSENTVALESQQTGTTATVTFELYVVP